MLHDSKLVISRRHVARNSAQRTGFDLMSYPPYCQNPALWWNSYLSPRFDHSVTGRRNYIDDHAIMKSFAMHYTRRSIYFRLGFLDLLRALGAVIWRLGVDNACAFAAAGWSILTRSHFNSTAFYNRTAYNLFLHETLICM